VRRRWIWLLPAAAALLLQLAEPPTFPHVPGLGPVPPSWGWVTAAIAVASALGAFRLMRALGVEGWLIPLALVIGSSAGVGALAQRGADGPSGAGFGMEPLALCLLIWCYDAVVRAHVVRAGVLLGAAGLAHPLALAHGLLVVGAAALFGGEGRLRRFGLTVAIALAAGAPALIQLALGAIDIVRMDTAAAARLIDEGYLFRYPASYRLQGLFWEQGLARVLLVLAGGAGALALLRGGRSPASRSVLGLITGHALLSAFAVLCYTRRIPGPWARSVTAYALDLTLTSSLLPLICGVALMAAVEQQLGSRAAPRALRLALAAAAVTLLLTVDWTGMALRQRATGDPLERPDAELYAWARTTPKRTSFIVPPGARGFRYHTRKGVYVDYDLIPPASPRAMRTWRDRVDLISQPDARLASVPPWRRPYEMDRAYARANSPARIATLLEQLGENYLVWDARGLEIPPHLPGGREPDSRVSEVFRNERYVVYGLAAKAARAAP
jgi:hypothetical protein